MGMTPDEIQAAIEKALKRSTEKPTRRPIRAAIQGASMGFSDEAEALGLSALRGTSYDDEIARSRGKLEQYRKDYPIEALGAELGGGVLTGVLTGGVGGGATLGRMAAQGLVQGAITGAGTADGNLSDRATGAAIGGVGGAILAPVAGVALSGLGAGVSAMAKSMFGQRGATAVQNELQRLVKEGGTTVDEVIDAIANGTLMVENQTLKKSIRAFYTGGGNAGETVRQTLTNRPAQTRDAAMAEMRKYLSGGTGTARAQQAAKVDAERGARKAAYAPYENMPAPPEVVDELSRVLQAAPQAANSIEAAMRARMAPPLVTQAENGAITFSRTPTVSEAELIRRAVKGNVDSLYRDPMTAVVAGELKGVEAGLRNTLDRNIPSLGAVRADVASQEAAAEAFDAGVKSLSGDANQVILDIEKIVSNPELLASYKRGFLATIERRALTSQRDSMIAKLADVEGKNTTENLILRSLFGPDEINGLMRKLKTASDSSSASNYVLKGSATQETQAAESRIGSSIGMSDVADAVTGSPSAIMSVVSKMVSSAASGLTDDQRAKVAQLLVSEYPDVVRAAMTDRSGADRLFEIIQKTAAIMNRGAQGGVATGTGLLGGTIASPNQGLTLNFNTPNDAQ